MIFRALAKSMKRHFDKNLLRSRRYKNRYKNAKHFYINVYPCIHSLPLNIRNTRTNTQIETQVLIMK